MFFHSELHLATSWPCLSEETIVDDNDFSYVHYISLVFSHFAMIASLLFLFRLGFGMGFWEQESRA